MITLWLRFPGGRYHATPWGHHVNEGLVEWPPSPWRLLRALLAVGFNTLGWREIPEEARALVLTLASCLPHYRLPPAVGAHSRHYMPAPQNKTLVFDTFLRVGEGELAVFWPLTLEPGLRRLLADLAARLNYLGRGESWVEARVDDQAPEPNAWPEGVHPAPGPGWEQTPLFAPVPPADYAAWRLERVAAELASLPVPEPGKRKPTKADKALLAARQAKEAAYPADLLECLQKDTAWFRGLGWSQPPGARRVFYWRPSNLLQVCEPAVRMPRSAPPVEAMLLALKTAGGNDHELPHVARVLPQGDLLHQALVSCAGRGGRVACPVLIGKDQQGLPLKGHGHAHLLHLDLDGDGHLDHALIWAPMGLDHEAQAAIRGLRRTYAKGVALPLRVTVVGAGVLRDFLALPEPMGMAMGRIWGGLAGATEWISETPFVPPRFLKKRGPNTLELQVQAELASRGLPPAARVLNLMPGQDERARSLRHFIRVRRRGQPPPLDVGFALRLEFTEPVHGPLALGYGSHFGLGLFTATP